MSSRDDAWLASISGPSASRSARAERAREIADAHHLVDRVATARDVAHLIECRVAQHLQAELGGDGLALGAALRVGRRFESAGNSRMHDEYTELGGQREVLDGERPAVEEHGVVGAAEHRGHLVLDAARHARRHVLGALRGERELDAVERESRRVRQGQRARNLKRRTRRESRPDRNGRGDGRGRRRPGDDRARRGPGRPRRPPDPMADASRPGSSRPSAAMSTSPSKSDERATTRPSARGVAVTMYVAVDRERNDPALVVVDLTADQVDAPRRTERTRPVHASPNFMRHRTSCVTELHASRSAWAAASGTTGFDNVPLPTSPEAT